MTTKQDLTFTELNTALGGAAITLDAPNSDILISVKAITGNSYTALTNTGVLKATKKIRESAYNAQETANKSIPDEAEHLTTYSPPTNQGYSSGEGGVVFSFTETYINHIDFNVVTGSNS
jgi:hypothetical protein